MPVAWITPVTSPKATVLAVGLFGNAVVLDEFDSGVGRRRATPLAGLSPLGSTSGPDSCGDVGLQVSERRPRLSNLSGSYCQSRCVPVWATHQSHNS